MAAVPLQLVVSLALLLAAARLLVLLLVVMLIRALDVLAILGPALRVLLGLLAGRVDLVVFSHSFSFIQA